MKFKDLIDYCRLEAYYSAMVPTEDSVWRAFAREYSAKFHTPLKTVMDDLNPEFVILNVLEAQMEGVEVDENIEQILDIIYTISDPEYSAQKASEQAEFDARTVKEEKERKMRGESIHKYLLRNSVKKQKMAETAKQKPQQASPIPPGSPTKGHIDLSYLDAEEKNSQGFKRDE
jgi:cysteinyl-tRNA synthetase